jgi:hypothetical protein
MRGAWLTGVVGLARGVGPAEAVGVTRPGGLADSVGLSGPFDTDPPQARINTGVRSRTRRQVFATISPLQDAESVAKVPCDNVRRATLDLRFPDTCLPERVQARKLYRPASLSRTRHDLHDDQMVLGASPALPIGDSRGKLRPMV